MKANRISSLGRALNLSLQLLFLLGLACATHANETRDLYLVAGQSNAVGYDCDSAALPGNAGDSQVMFWWRCGDPPPDDHDSFSNGWTTLQPQPKGNPRPPNPAARQYGNFQSERGGFGPEMGFARELQTKELQPFAIVKVAFNGTGMTTDWDHDNSGEPGACYRALVAETKNAIKAASEKGIDLRIQALIWVQGESDANAKDAQAYEKNLGGMIKALRQDLTAPNMIALVGVNTNFGAGGNRFIHTIVEQQKALARALPMCAYVDTSGVSYANAAHFDTKGSIVIGGRFADSLLHMEQKP
jgi:hypothetical protein